jgi:hypothetical protein
MVASLIRDFSDALVRSWGARDRRLWVLRRIVRVASPTTLVFALLLFVLPFLTVSCDTPGGFGRTERGGTTSYSGLALAVGSSPSIDDDHLRPVSQQEDDELGAQPIVLAAFVALVATLVMCIRSRTQRAVRMGLGAIAGVALAVGVLVARASLVDKVATQADHPFPKGKEAGDYVNVGAAFWASLVMVVLAIALSALEGRLEARHNGHDPPIAR